MSAISLLFLGFPVGELLGDELVGNLLGDEFVGNLLGNRLIGNLLGNKLVGNLVGDKLVGNLLGDKLVGNLLGTLSSLFFFSLHVRLDLFVLVYACCCCCFFFSVSSSHQFHSFIPLILLFLRDLVLPLLLERLGFASSS